MVCTLRTPWQPWHRRRIIHTLMNSISLLLLFFFFSPFSWLPRAYRRALCELHVWEITSSSYTWTNSILRSPCTKLNLCQRVKVIITHCFRKKKKKKIWTKEVMENWKSLVYIYVVVFRKFPVLHLRVSFLYSLWLYLYGEMDFLSYFNSTRYSRWSLSLS